MIMAASCLVGLLLIQACDDEEVTKVQKATKLLISNGATWKPGSVTIDGVDLTEDLFKGFSIQFSETGFATTGTSPVFDADDSWTFKDDTGTVILRGQDDKELTIVSLTKDQLVFTLDWDQTTTEPIDEGGRKKSLKGLHEFTLVK